VDHRARLSFAEWCEKISHFLQAGESFKHETFKTEPSVEDIYGMLPQIWHAMPPVEKKVVASAANRHNKEFGVECSNEVHRECSISMRICRISVSVWNASGNIHNSWT
jgi:hypothetical protein